MKLMIADDQARRYGRLVEALGRVGVAREQIDIVGCAQDAREHLETTQYDLLILDILLPLWPEGEPSVQHSCDVLLELNESDTYKKPRRILGITADPRIAGDVAGKFAEWTWTVVEYSDSNDDWINRALNCVRYILEESKQNSAVDKKSRVDLAIVCALERPELEEVLKLPWDWSSARPIDDVTFVYDGKLMAGDRVITVCATAAPRMGMVSTALRSAAVIALLRPRLIAMCGICAGVKEKVRMGDVLFVDPAWDFQSGKRVRDKENASFSIAPHQLHSPALIRTHVQQVASDHDVLARMSAKFGSDAPGASRVLIGPVASGSAVLADGQVINEIKTQHRELIGVEMEAYGLYAAAYSASQPQPLPFAVKGVCDFADPDKENQYQRYAAYASANVLRLLMERFGARLLP